MHLELTRVPEKVITSSHSNTKTQRRYDVDWLRILALGLLIIYHVVITFQPWAGYIGFIVNDEPIEWLWTIMEMINVWRIPILFLISGMGVAFAMERRNWRQLLQDRTLRILLPFGFGYFFIAPIMMVAMTQFYINVYSIPLETTYEPGMWHLWFLGNIFVYVLILLPLFYYWKHNPDNLVLRFLTNLFQHPLGLFVMAIPLMIEATIVNPEDFVVYAGTWHGFWLGMACFLMGFIFISLRDTFWDAVVKSRRIALPIAFALYLTRVWEIRPDDAQNALLGFESMCWMLAILGFGAVYLNHASNALHYLSQAVYPVYILHMPVQFVISYYIVQMNLSAEVKLMLLLVGTFGISMLLYEIIRRIKWIRPLFGLKFNAT